MPADRDIMDIGLMEDLQNVQDSLPDCDWSVGVRDRRAVGEGPSTSRRYYSIIGVTCNNCNSKGHLSKVCPKPKKNVVCILCSGRGHHWKICPDGLCYNCSAPGHTSKDCDKPRRSRFFKCTRCQQKGHGYKDCPDTWRQYHLTTQQGQLCRGNSLKHPRDNVSCYNCGEVGHYGHECEEERMTHHGMPLLPFIARYDKPEIQNSRKRRRLKDETEKADDGRKKSKKCREKEHTDDENKKMEMKKKQKEKQLMVLSDDEHTEYCKQKKERQRKKKKVLKTNGKKEYKEDAGHQEDKGKKSAQKKQFTPLPWMKDFITADLTCTTEKLKGKKLKKKKTGKRNDIHQENDQSSQPKNHKRAKRKRTDHVIDLTEECSPVPRQTYSTRTSKKHAKSSTGQPEQNFDETAHRPIKKQKLWWTAGMGCTFQTNSSFQGDVFQNTFLAGYEAIFE